MKSQFLMGFSVGLAGFVATPAPEGGLSSLNFLSSLRLVGKRALAALVRRRPRFDTSQLHQLSDHMLKDIGLSRSELQFGISGRVRR